MLNLSSARRIVDGAILRAQQLNINISVAVCDNRGCLVALNRMDGAVAWQVDRASIAKAIASAMIGRPSEELIEHITASGQRFVLSSNIIPPQGQRGGLPIMQESIIQGGCGVSGATTLEQDQECAHAGIASLDAAMSPLPIAI